MPWRAGEILPPGDQTIKQSLCLTPSNKPHQAARGDKCKHFVGIPRSPQEISRFKDYMCVNYIDLHFPRGNSHFRWHFMLYDYIIRTIFDVRHFSNARDKLKASRFYILYIFKAKSHSTNLKLYRSVRGQNSWCRYLDISLHFLGLCVLLQGC